MSMPLVDVHAHVFPRALDNRYERTGDSRWPWLTVDATHPADGSGVVMVGDRPFRQVRPSLWDVDHRAADLDSAGIVHQVVSPMPVLMTYWTSGREAASFSREVNDGVASYVESAPGSRLSALGTVPLQDPDLATQELERCVQDLGFAGVQIGPRAGGRDLDDPRLLPFLARAAELEAVVAVHPLDGGTGVIRREGSPYDFGLGMITDTAIAGTALVFGGVLEQLPTLRVVLAHGCGSFPWAYPRLRFGATLREPASVGARFDDLVRRLWVDTLVFEPAHIGLLVERFGEDKVVVGTDHPFITDQLDPVRDFLARQPDRLIAAVTRLNACSLLGVDPSALQAG